MRHRLAFAVALLLAVLIGPHLLIDAGTSITGGGGVTLDGAYDFGGSGAGRAITADTGAVTITNNAANTNNVLEITKAPAGAQTGSGFTITMTPGAAAAATGMVVTMGANTSSAGYAATFDWRAAAGTAAGNGIVNLEVGAATTLTGQLVGQEIDLSANVTAGANAVIGQRILIPATTRANTAGEGAIVVNSDATRARALDIDVANTGDTVAVIRWGAATTLADSTTGLNIDMITNVTGNAQTERGLLVTTASAASSASFCAGFDYRTTAGTVAGNGVLNVEVGAATTLTGQLVGAEIDLSTNVTAGANAVIGTRILIPATTRANTAGEGAIVVNSDATAARVLDLDIGNTSGNAAYIRWGSAATLAGATGVLVLDASTNVTPGSNAVTGIDLDMPASSSASTFGIDLDSTQTAGDGINVNMAPGSSAAVRGAAITMGANATGAGLAITHSGSGNHITLQADSGFFRSAAAVIDVTDSATGSGALALREDAALPTAQADKVLLTAQDTGGRSRAILRPDVGADMYPQGTLAKNVTAVGTGANTAEFDLQTYSLTAATLGTAGGLRLTAAGTIAGTTDAKTVRLYFGATVVGTVSVVAGATSDWDFELLILNDAATGAQVLISRAFEAGVADETDTYRTAAIDTTLAVTIKTTGTTPNAADEVTSEILTVELLP